MKQIAPLTLALWTLAAVQFVNVWDAILVAPLGPDLSKRLSFDPTHVGFLTASYTGAAALSSFLTSFFIDRLPLYKTLMVCLVGLALGTFLCGLAVDFNTLLAARTLTGMFGGPAGALTLALATELFPIHQRGKAIGTIFGAFSLAAIFGVPLSLEFGQRFSSLMSFWVVSACAFALVPLTMLMSAKLRLFTPTLKKEKSTWWNSSLLQDRYTYLALASTICILISVFCLIPILPAVWVFNFRVPWDDLTHLYFFGGFMSIFSMILAGFLNDKGISATAIALPMTLLVIPLVTGLAWFSFTGIWAAYVFLMGLFFLNGMRSVTMVNLFTRIPDANNRGRYQALQNTVQQLGAAFGSYLGSIATYTMQGQVHGLGRVVLIMAFFGIAAMILLGIIEGHLKKKSL